MSRMPSEMSCKSSLSLSLPWPRRNLLNLVRSFGVGLGILGVLYPLYVQAQDSPIEILKKQISAPTILRAEQFQLQGKTYVAAILKDPFLLEPKIRIYSFVRDTFDEVYDDVGSGEKLIELLAMDLTGDKNPEVVTTWMCGQIGLKCITIVAWDFKAHRFREIFASQAFRIELGPKQEGKPVRIFLFDEKGEGSPTRRVNRRVYVWERGKFVKTVERASGK